MKQRSTADKHTGRLLLLRQFAVLRWRTLRGALQSAGSQRWTVLIGLIASISVGMVGGVALAVAGRTASDPRPLFVIACTAIAVFIVALGVIAGISQPIDPRVLATEPLSERQLAVGLLTGSAVGPPGISGMLIGLGLLVGAIRDVASILPVALAVASFLATLLIISRSSINLLGLFATRFPRAGQIVVGVASLVFYGGFQFVPVIAGGFDQNEQRELADVLQYSPPGQLGLGLYRAGDEPLRALGNVVIGSLWLPALAMAFVWTTQRLLVTVKRTDLTGMSADEEHSRRQPIRATARRLAGKGPVGAVAWRGLLTRLRTPRSALETFTGAGVGMAVVLVPTLIRDGVGAGAVLVGGAVQLAVLFMGGNCFGSDGPAISNELLCGVDPDVIVRGKARSLLIVASPIAVVGPVIAAGVTGEWNFLIAGFLVGAGGLLGGAGGAIVQSTLVPIAIPEGDNPLASGDSGKGCLAGLILAGVVVVLSLATLPIALGLLWAVNRGSVVFVTLLAVGTVGAGWLVYQLGIRSAVNTWRRKEPEIFAAVIPTR